MEGAAGGARNKGRWREPCSVSGGVLEQRGDKDKDKKDKDRGLGGDKDKHKDKEQGKNTYDNRGYS